MVLASATSVDGCQASKIAQRLLRMSKLGETKHSSEPRLTIDDRKHYLNGGQVCSFVFEKRRKGELRDLWGR